VSDWNARVIDEFRSNNGRVGGPFEGAHLLLLTTIGARSGRARTVPLGFFTDGDQLLLLASKAGADAHPAWFHNVLAEARVRVEVGGPDGIDKFAAVASPVADEYRAQRLDEVRAFNPGFSDYQSGHGRPIPMVAIRRA